MDENRSLFAFPHPRSPDAGMPFPLPTRGRRTQGCNSIALLRATARHPLPIREPVEIQRVLRHRLLTLMEWLDRRLAAPFTVRDHGELREITVFDAFVYRVDREARSISLGQREDDVFAFTTPPLEVLHPLSTHVWLWDIIGHLGLSAGSGPQLDLLSSRSDGERRDSWLARSAYALLKADPRFRLMRRALHRAFSLDVELLRIALLARRPAQTGLTNEQYARVWRQEDGLKRIARVCPKLLPLAAVAVMDERMSFGRYPLAELKSMLVERHRLGDRVWRLLVRQGARILRPAWEVCNNRRSRITAAVKYLALLQNTDAWRTPPPSVVRTYLRQDGDEINFGGWQPREPTQVLRIAFSEADRMRRSPLLPAFIDDFLLVCRWASTVHPELDNAQSKAGWPSLVRRARHWERERLERSRVQNIRWPLLLETFAHGAYTAVALRDSHALVEEGFAMRHCISQFSEDCMSGMVRVYSVRDAATGKRVATLAITFDRKEWFAVEMKRFANQPVGGDLRAFSEALIERLNADMAALHSRVKSSGFSEETWSQAVPWLDFMATWYADAPIKYYFRRLIELFGASIKPYAFLHARERGLGRQLPKSRELLARIAQ